MFLSLIISSFSLSNFSNISSSSFVSLPLSSSSIVNSSHSNHSISLDLWCSYLQEYPEPSFLFYNRLGKAGSTTMREYLRILSKRNHFSSIDMTPNYWLDFEDNQSIKNSFEKQILDKYSTNHHPVIVNGHWAQYLFNSSTFLSKHLEYFQLIRNCSTIATSHLLYNLFDSSAAKHANQSNPLRVRQILRINNQSNVTIEECLQNEECISKSHYFDRFDQTLLTALCGKQCQKNYAHVAGDHHNNTARLGVLSNLHNPLVFTIIGVLEHLPAFFSLLECVYPTLLSGIRDIDSLTLFFRNFSSG